MSDSDSQSGSSAREAKERFLDALELEGAARLGFLRELEERDAALAERVRGLLVAHAGGAAAALESMGGDVRRLLDDAIGHAGTVIGDYELIEEIASGASGVVWRARQISLDRTVALKVLRAGRIAGKREVERFRAEAEVVANLHHPHVVPVYEVGDHEGRHFFSMRFYSGGSLAERLGPDTPWEGRAAAAMVAVLARAVHHAHQRGLLHRDLKPSNVLLDEHDEPAVADFGVAARIDAAGVAEVTRTLAGTPAYMAPEQTGLGGAQGELTVATDVWALGCILYELLAGQPPFLDDTVSGLLGKVRQEAPLPLRALAPDTPRDLETIVLRCLTKEAGRRYASANALAIDLGRFLEHEPILARRTGPLERLGLLWRRSPVTTTLGFVVVALVLALAVGASWAKIQLERSLRESYLGEARATRLSGETGRRAYALGLLAKADRLRPGPDVRDEAIACLATRDLQSRVTVEFEFGEMGVAALDPDEDLLVHAEGEELIVLRPSDRVELARYTSGGRCENLRLAPGGELLLYKVLLEETGTREVCVLSLATGEELLRMRGNWALAGAAAFDPSATRVAFGDTSGRVSIVDVASGEVERVLELGLYVGGLIFSADGTTLAIGTEGAEDPDVGLLHVVSVPAGELLQEVDLPSFPFVLTWGAEGTLLYGGQDYDVYRVTLGEEPGVTPWLIGHRAEVTTLEVSPAEPLVATSSWDRTLRLWDLAMGEELMRVPANFLNFSSTGEQLAYRTATAIEIVDVVRPEALRVLHGHGGKAPASAAFSRDGGQLVTYGDDGALLWDLASGRSLGWLTREDVDGAVYTPDGGLLLSGPGGLELRSAAAPLQRGVLLVEKARQNLDLSADGRLLALRNGRELELMDPDDPSAVRRVPAYQGFEYVDLGAGGTYVAGQTWKGSGISVWRASDGELLGRLREDRFALGAAISPDETRLVVGDGIDYQVYALPGLERIAVVPRDVAMRETPGLLAFSEDGELLVLGLSEDTVGLFDARTLESVARLEATRATFDGRATFSPDGRLLALSSFTNRLFLWDLDALRRGLEGAGIGWE